MSFFDTAPVKFVRTYGWLILANLVEAFIGFIWVGFLWLFVMFWYQLRTIYKKAIVEDRKEYKITYRDMNKRSRTIAAAFAIFLMISITLLIVEDEMFL